MNINTVKTISCRNRKNRPAIGAAPKDIIKDRWLYVYYFQVLFGINLQISAHARSLNCFF